MHLRSILCVAVCSIVLSSSLTGCSSAPIVTPPSRPENAQAVDVAMYALMLRDTGYKFGGKNPEAGLDCSGMVTYVYQQAVGMKLNGNAAALAQQGREIDPAQLRTGDLVFFNTSGRPFSHVGIYLGKGEFIHAPNSRGRVRVDKFTNGYYVKRFEMARALLE